VRFTVTFTAGALRDLESLPGPIAWAVIAFCDGPLSENPHRVGKALRYQLSGLHSARRGEYRVIYRIDDAVITVDVIRVRHRGRAYGR
jgi:mRNA-degrading endonuclease RelE of RelBE toxin-antitoxin system